VATFDESLGKLLADCDKHGWGDEAVWLITSSRGFPLGEHGPVGDAATALHEELVHLPLILRMPNSQWSGMRSSALTQPMDLAPTLRDLFGLALRAVGGIWTGGSLLPIASGGENLNRKQAVTGQARDSQSHWGYRTPSWYLMLDGQRRLFAKPDDRWEVNDVAVRNQDHVEEMEREFRTYLAPSQ
jgi:arylsulfatase A-like enzyme